jgi:hypothetical protein
MRTFKKLSVIGFLLLLTLVIVSTSIVYARPFEASGNIVITKDEGNRVEGYLINDSDIGIMHSVAFVATSDIGTHVVSGNTYVWGLSSVELSDKIEKVAVVAYLYEDDTIIDAAFDTQENANAAIAENESQPYVDGCEYMERGYHSMNHDGELRTVWSYERL